MKIQSYSLGTLSNEKITQPNSMMESSKTPDLSWVSLFNNMKYKLYEYQEQLVKGLAVSISRGINPVIGQLPTGEVYTILKEAAN